MKVAILLAVYEPRIDWFRELLQSLNDQTYRDLHLYVRNDASPKTDSDLIERTVSEMITNFPYTYLKNEQNLGSNKTFEALVRDCKEEYVAFCDQDDVWLPKKVENTLCLLEGSSLHPKLVCTDVQVIDGAGQVIAPDIRSYRNRHVFLRGNDLASSLLYRNFVIGCTAMLRREDALHYLPFPKNVVHDHYLAYRCALEGAIDYLGEPQMQYRVYGGNQTGVLMGVKTKSDYYRLRIAGFRERLETFETGKNREDYQQASAWCTAREAYFKREKGSFRKLWKMRRQDIKTTLFELLLLRAPNFLFAIGIRMVQKRIL